MPVLGMDIAWSRPTVAVILATGARWVARYFSTDASKNLTASEVHDYPAAGLSVVTVWETTTGRATQGRAAGVADAQAAEAQRRAVGLPDTHVHHFAVDEDTSWASVQPYFDGVISWLGLGRTGLYGGFPVVEGAAAHGIRFLWQTTAWSGGRWSAHATIRQTGGTLLAGAADVDYAEVLDFGQFPRPSTPPEPDMPFSPADLAALAHAVAGYKNPETEVDAHQRWVNADVKADALAAQVTALAAKVATPAPVVLSDAQVAAMAAALAPAVADLLAKRLAN